MAKPLSEDLRSRLIAAVNGGMSRRAAAKRFGVGAATAIRWVRAWRATGTTRAIPQGGDKRSHRIEAYREVILGAIEAQVDITLLELADMLRRDHGTSFAPSTVWRCLDRHAMTVKKRPRTPASRSGPTSPRGAGLGSTRSPISTPSAWSSSTRPGRRPGWPGCEAVPDGDSAAGRRCRTAMCGRPARCKRFIGRRRPSPERCA